MGDPAPQFLDRRNNRIVLYGWRNLTALNIAVLAALTAFLMISVVLSIAVGPGWLPAVAVALALFCYAFWALYESVVTRLEFVGKSLEIRGQIFAVADCLGFCARHTDAGLGIDDEPGWIEIWLEVNNAEPYPVALMSKHADGDAIVATLNARLTSAQSA